MNVPSIKTVNLNKFYGNFQACRDINLSINKGEVFAFTGPNGAGKTTTIKMITGILVPSSGDIFINGVNIREDDISAKKMIGYVPDRPFLYEKLTGYEFLHFVKEIFEVEDNIFNRSVEELAEVFELKGWLDELIENYSHGMKQKLLLISAFSHNPEIYIMDEPLVGLDPKSAKNLKNYVREYSKRGKTFFISTHILSLVDEIATHLAIIKKGEIVLYGKLEEIRKNYSDTQLEDYFLKIVEE
ncbi:MAG: ABC transporter ATP-binding protein [Deltaproteobacteria bacterium]|nr:ABC transporter ATP-binding protein [Deltaproteobacteria bacterium]